MIKIKKLYYSVLVFLFVLSIVDIGFMKYLITHYEMNRDHFTQVGMMEYVNPVDNRVLYIPIYQKQKGDK